MNSKFTRFRMILILLVASTAADSALAQGMPSQNQSGFSTTGNNRLAPIANQSTSGTLPPIVSGTLHAAPQQGVPSPSSLPPFVSGAQNTLPSVIPNGQANVPPIVQGAMPLNSGSTTKPAVAERTNPLLPIQNVANNQPTKPTVGRPASNSTATQPANPVQAWEAPQQVQSSRPQAQLPQLQNRPGTSPTLSSSGVPFYQSNPSNESGFIIAEPQMRDRSELPAKNVSSNSGLTKKPTFMKTQDSVLDPIQREPAGVAEGVIAPRVVQDATTQPEMGMPRATREPNGMPGESYFSSPGYTDFTPGCQDCIAAGGMESCPTCNPGAGFNSNAGFRPGAGFNADGLRSDLGYFGAMSCARRYVELDMLYLTRTDGSIVFSNAGGLGSFDAAAGWRGTIGQRDDETQGREISYFGTSDIEKSIDRFDPGGRLSALFQPVGVIDVGLTAPFFDAEVQNEQMRTRLHSFEINRVRWGWDVVKSFIGFRFIHVDDSYTLFSQRGATTGDYRLRSYNNMSGVHIGRELFYDVGYRISFSALGKAGVYANANQFRVNVANNGIDFLANRNNSSTFSTSLELMLTGHYQINRRARFRMGYQALLLDDVYTISDNLTGALSPFFGSRKPDKDSLFMHGVNLGLEFYR